jgi:hypothetical protein
MPLLAKQGVERAWTTPPMIPPRALTSSLPCSCPCPWACGVMQNAQGRGGVSLNLKPSIRSRLRKGSPRAYSREETDSRA